MSAYYNEIDPFCCQWLKNLIAKNLIAPGEVDERDIRDVKPDDLRGMTDEDCEIWVRILLGVGFRVMNSRTGYNIFDRSLVMDRKDAMLMFSRAHAGRDACRVL